MGSVRQQFETTDLSKFHRIFISDLLRSFLNDHYGNYSTFSNLLAMVPHFLHVLLRTKHCLLYKIENIGFISIPTSERMISQEEIKKLS
jgi:hypothetical protein